MTRALFLLFALPIASYGGTISFGELDFISPVLEIGSGTFVSIPSGTTAGQYSIGANLVSNASGLDLSSVQIICNTVGGCGPLDLEFQATSGSGSGDLLFVQTQLDGTGDSASGFAQICVADSQHICSSNGSGSQSITIPFEGAITGSDSNTFSLVNGFNVLGDFHLDGLPHDSTGVTLSNSFSITLEGSFIIKSSPPPEVPEPGTMDALITGIVLLLARYLWLLLKTRELKNNLKA